MPDYDWLSPDQQVSPQDGTTAIVNIPGSGKKGCQRIWINAIVDPKTGASKIQYVECGHRSCEHCMRKWTVSESQLYTKAFREHYRSQGDVEQRSFQLYRVTLPREKAHSISHYARSTGHWALPIPGPDDTTIVYTTHKTRTTASHYFFDDAGFPDWGYLEQMLHMDLGRVPAYTLKSEVGNGERRLVRPNKAMRDGMVSLGLREPGSTSQEQDEEPEQAVFERDKDPQPEGIRVSWDFVFFTAAHDLVTGKDVYGRPTNIRRPVRISSGGTDRDEVCDRYERYLGLPATAPELQFVIKAA
jgi:hypothetical protein